MVPKLENSAPKQLPQCFMGEVGISHPNVSQTLHLLTVSVQNSRLGKDNSWMEAIVPLGTKMALWAQRWLETTSQHVVWGDQDRISSSGSS